MATASLNAASTAVIIIDTVNNRSRKQIKPINSIHSCLSFDGLGNKIFSLMEQRSVLISVASDLTAEGYGNTIFGITNDPDAAQVAAEGVLGVVQGSGGGGGGGGITQSEVKTAIESATNLDQLETLLGNLGTYTDGLEALNTAINGYVDGLEGLQSTGNVSLTSIDAKLTALIDRIKNPGRGYSSTAIGTRAANTTAYAANDVYGGILEFTNIGPAGGVISLNNLQTVFNFAALPVNMGAFRVYLHNAPPVSNVADNGAFSIPAGDRVSILNPSALIFGASLAIGAGSVIGATTGINTQVKLAPGSTSLWAYLVTGTAFTPAAASETFKITLSTLGT